MKRIIWHWTAGGHKANSVDLAAYHAVVEGNGHVEWGIHKITDNENISDGHYARHTRNLNTGSIGVAVAAMHNAQERPFDTGPYPITQKQVDALVHLTARLCKQYGIPVTRRTVLSHAEVEPTLKVKQRNKWDITWIPSSNGLQDPVNLGDKLRLAVTTELAKLDPPQETPKTKRPSNFCLTIRKALRGRK